MGHYHSVEKPEPMKIIRAKAKQLAATLIIVFLALVVIGIGGTFVFHLRKWAKRVYDNNPPPAPYTNSSQFDVPPGYNYTSISIHPIMHWWLEVPDGPCLAQAGAQTTPKRVIHVGFTNGNLILTPLLSSDWVSLDLSTNFDANGFPLEFDYGTPEGIVVTVEWSTNGTDWSKLLDMTAPAMFKDESPVSQIYYRARYK